MSIIKKLIEDADTALSAGNYDLAIDLYKQVLKQNPRNHHVLECLQTTEKLKKLLEQADDAYYTAEYKNALQLYKQALELNAEDKHAQKQIRKAERARPAETNEPKAVPNKSLQLYRRARSLISMRDLIQAKKLLIKAIDLADEDGVTFSQAQALLGNIQNALIADGFKARAYESIDNKLWSKADSELTSALELDPTDEIIQTLFSHLRSLLKAQSLLRQLDAEIVSGRERSKLRDEVRTIIANTGETTILSTLWQEVVRLFGDYNNKNAVYRDRNKIFRWMMLFTLSTSVILLITFWLLYIYPRHRGVSIACEAIAPGLEARLEYPYYIASGDHHELEMTFINNSKSKIESRFIPVQFHGTANIEFLNPERSNLVELANLLPGKQEQKEVPFYVDGSSSLMPGPWYISFSVGSCNPKDFYIAMAAIPGLQNIMKALGTIIVGALLGLFNDWVKDLMKWIASRFPKPQDDPRVMNPPNNI